MSFFKYSELFTKLIYHYLNKLASTYGKRIVLIFLYILYKGWRMSESSFSHSHHSCFPISFVSKATNFCICSLNRLALKKSCWHLAGFLQLSNLFFLCICKYSFQMLVNCKEKKTFLICKINSFQNQNTYERNFNLRINKSCLFNSNNNSTYTDQISAIYHTAEHFWMCGDSYVCDCIPFLKGPAKSLNMAALLPQLQYSTTRANYFRIKRDYTEIVL